MSMENFVKLNAHVASLQTDNAALRKNMQIATDDAYDLASLRVIAEAAQHRQTKLDREALAFSRGETQTGLTNLIASAAALASSRAETHSGQTDLLASAAALASSRAETHSGQTDLLASEVALASSRAETQLGQADLLASEVVNKALGLANALLVTSAAALAESEARFRAVVETTPECIMLVAANRTLLQVNRAGLQMMESGASAITEGGCVLGFIAEEHQQTWVANHERVCNGEALKWDFDLVGLLGTRRRMETHATPLKLLDGQTAQLAISRDVTMQRKTDELQTLLSREVDHRAKNVLAVVLSLLRMTPRDDAAYFAASVEGRVAAIARAHSILAAEKWANVDFCTVAKAELAAYVGRVSMSGPTVNLKADAVQSMAMVLHELATNAMKYGALMSRDGRVELSWDMLDNDGGLRLYWQEFGGPPVHTAPIRRGFGSRLIDTLVTRQLSGSVCADWLEQGLLLTLELPQRFVVKANPVSILQNHGMIIGRDQHWASASNVVTRADAPLPRVLMVEDEAMLAMELEVTLCKLSCEVIVAGTLAEAVRRAVTEPNLSVAILDVDLGNAETSFAVIDLLHTRGVPYILATGYGSVASLNGYDHGAVAVLSKPYSQETLADALCIALKHVSQPLGR